VYGETCGTASRVQIISVRLLLVGVHKGLGIISIDSIDVLRERVENAATTIHSNRGMLERVEESLNHFVGAFIIVSTITAFTLNSSCN
jgi:hypothetical protein